MIKKAFLLIFLVVSALIFIGCSTTSGENSIDKIRLLGGEGEWVYTSSELPETDLPFSFSIDRVSLSYSPSDGGLYGFIEGDFTKIAANLALSSEKSFNRKSKNGNTFFVNEETGFQLLVFENGLILFSSDDVLDFCRKVKTGVAGPMQESVSLKMLACDNALWLNRPTSLPDLGIPISDSAISKFDYILVTETDDKSDIEFAMQSEDDVPSFNILLKSAYIVMLRLQNKSVNVNELKNIIVDKDQSVFLLNQEIHLDIIGLLSEK